MEPEARFAHCFSEDTFSRLRTAEDVQVAVDEATAHSKAIFLVHIPGAPMVRQRKLFAEFRRDYRTRYPKSDLVFRYIDCSTICGHYETLRSLTGWKELEELSNGSSLVHGYGELAWWGNGRILQVERPLELGSIDALIAKTESLGMVVAE